MLIILFFHYSKFTNVFGSSRLLGSLALSPPGIRRQEKEGAKVSLAKEREVSSSVHGQEPLYFLTHYHVHL